MHKKLAAEAFGTFCLVFAGAGAIVVNDVSGGVITHVGIAITFGLVVMAMIYSFGEVSGSHLNPAVTISFAVDKQLEWKLVLPYIASQLIGAFFAIGVLLALFPLHPTLGATLPAGSQLQSFIFEFLLTLILMVVILGVANGSENAKRMAGLVIGGVIALEALFAGPVCGASMNPARSIAPLMASQHFSLLWLYTLAPTLGAITAIPIYHLIHSEESTAGQSQ